ncbi:MAG TPA: YceI family protein [Patescibacteria group bacterium]|nr:YceI family protein [Patescibacteria group bacterium]
MRAFVAVVGLLLLPALAARPDTDRDLTLDADASRVHFQLQALGWFPVRGDARAEGSIQVRDALAAIDVRVPLASLQMNRAGYRDWALSPEFFAAARHPEIGFRATAIPLQRLHDGGEILGELRVRGQARPARFVLVAGDCAETAAHCRVQATGELSRRAFGMRTRRYTLGDRIRIVLDLRLVPAP